MAIPHAELLRAANAALAHGLKNKSGAPNQIDARLDEAYSTRMAQALSAQEIQLLGIVTGDRERGLALCRAGNLGEGDTAISRARRRLVHADVGREAYVLSDSFLCAAEAFVHYRSGRLQAATSSLVAAIDGCRELRDEFGYLAEGRRIHLACNLARVELAADQQARSSRTLAQLLALLDTADRRHWPLPDLEYTTGPDTLPNDARWDLADQILDVGRRLDVSGVRALRDDSPTPTHRDSDNLAARTRCFLEAAHSDQTGDVDSFLNRCSEFFLPGPNSMPRGFRHLAKRLAVVSAG
jgi:hypothetical protein